MAHDGFWKDQRVVVGGGCGFLGSYVVPALVSRGASVTVVDDLSNGSLEHLEVGDRVSFVEGDLGQHEVADEVTTGCDIFLNLAARSFGMEYSRNHHGEMLVSNLLCGLVPLDRARANGVKRALTISTSCVYPDDAPVPTPELPLFTGAPESVNEGYGWAKRVQELASGYLASEAGMQVSIVRPFNLYGAHYGWESEEKAHVIPTLVKRVLDGNDPVVVWGSGNQRRNFLHGRDAAHLILEVVARGVMEPVNIGFDDTVTMRELVELICDVAGRSPELVFDTSKPEGAAVKSADPSRLRGIVGADYAPSISLREGITEMVDWYARSFGQEEAQRTDV